MSVMGGGGSGGGVASQGSAPIVGSAARVAAKRQELEGLRMLKEQSARLAKDIDKLGDNVDQLVVGGEGESERYCLG